MANRSRYKQTYLAQSHVQTIDKQHHLNDQLHTKFFLWCLSSVGYLIPPYFISFPTPSSMWLTTLDKPRFQENTCLSGKINLI